MTLNNILVKDICITATDIKRNLNYKISVCRYLKETLYGKDILSFLNHTSINFFNVHRFKKKCNRCFYFF